MFESVRTVIALELKRELRLCQFDKTTAFLKGELKEDIFMKPQKGFEMKGL